MIRPEDVGIVWAINNNGKIIDFKIFDTNIKEKFKKYYGDGIVWTHSDGNCFSDWLEGYDVEDAFERVMVNYECENNNIKDFILKEFSKIEGFEILN